MASPGVFRSNSGRVPESSEVIPEESPETPKSPRVVPKFRNAVQRIVDESAKNSPKSPGVVPKFRTAVERILDGRKPQPNNRNSHDKWPKLSQLSNFISSSFRFMSGTTTIPDNDKAVEDKKTKRKTSFGRRASRGATEQFLALKQAQRIGNVTRNAAKNRPQHYKPHRQTSKTIDIQLDDGTTILISNKSNRGSTLSEYSGASTAPNDMQPTVTIRTRSPTTGSQTPSQTSRISRTSQMSTSNLSSCPSPRNSFYDRNPSTKLTRSATLLEGTPRPALSRQSSTQSRYSNRSFVRQESAPAPMVATSSYLQLPSSHKLARVSSFDEY